MMAVTLFTHGKEATLAGQEALRCLLQRMVQRTAALVAAWMAATWPEHVMNQFYI